MKTLVGVPCSEMMRSRTAFSLFNLACERPDLTLSMQLGCDVAHNRNVIAQQALSGGYQRLLFVDSDMVFEPDTLDRMAAHHKDIVGLAANRRKLPLESVVKPLNVADLAKPLPKQLFEAAAVGTGVMLINTDVFRVLPRPWFQFEYVDGVLTTGEDVRFCRNAREAGFTIWVDPAVPIKHIGEYPY